jgi:hypothetical protein
MVDVRQIEDGMRREFEIARKAERLDKSSARSDDVAGGWHDTHSSGKQFLQHLTRQAHKILGV